MRHPASRQTFFIVLLLIAAAGGCKRAPEYFTFYSAEQRFSVELPENLRYSVHGSIDQIKNRGRSIERTRFIADGKDLTFEVAVAPVPEKVHGRDAMDFHVKALWNQIHNHGYTIISRGNATIYGMETVNMRVKRTDSVYTDLSIFEIDNRIFDLQVSARTLKGLNRPEAVNFFRSFKYDEQE
jgi:hypothetical protein